MCIKWLDIEIFTCIMKEFDIYILTCDMHRVAGYREFRLQYVRIG